MQFQSPSISELASAVYDYGLMIAPRGKMTTELIGTSMVWPLGQYPVREKMPRRLAAVEGVGLIAGSFSLPLIKLAAPAVDEELFTQSAKYSLSIARQVPHAVNLLKTEPSTRRAIVYFGRAVDVGGNKTTCLTSLQWMIREGQLHAILGMRSWDLAFGLPIDIVAVTILSLAVAQYLAVLPGTLVAQAGSLHVYGSSAHRAVSADPALGTVELKLDNPGSYRGWVGVRDEARSHFTEENPPWLWCTVS